MLQGEVLTEIVEILIETQMIQNIIETSQGFT